MSDFDAYWSAVDDELARYPAAPELELSPLRKTDYATVYHLKITSIGPYRLFGYYSVPAWQRPLPRPLPHAALRQRQPRPAP
ncbi:MAG: acetylxylan esterase [Chloroflexia bacterium]